MFISLCNVVFSQQMTTEEWNNISNEAFYKGINISKTEGVPVTGIVLENSIFKITLKTLISMIIQALLKEKKHITLALY